MKVNETRDGSKHKHDETEEDYEAFKKYWIEKTYEDKEKITLIYGQGEVLEQALRRNERYEASSWIKSEQFWVKTMTIKVTWVYAKIGTTPELNSNLKCNLIGRTKNN